MIPHDSFSRALDASRSIIRPLSLTRSHMKMSLIGKNDEYVHGLCDSLKPFILYPEAEQVLVLSVLSERRSGTCPLLSWLWQCTDLSM